MSAGLKRRDVIKGGLIGAAALAVPARALADPLGDAFDHTFVPPAAPAAPTPPALTVPAVPDPNPVYDRRVLEIAQREVARAGNAVWRRDIAGIADFARPSSLPRFHFANLENGTVRSFLVAHGRGSDPEHDGWLKQFSNVPGSEATSRGGYLTCEWYKGKYGTSIRLVGLDPDNSLALPRAIVVHPAWYVDPSMVSKWGKIGRSEGCFAMAPGDFNEALWHLSGGRLLYADRITLA
jgi:hypothetical protein